MIDIKKIYESVTSPFYSGMLNEGNGTITFCSTLPPASMPTYKISVFSKIRNPHSKLLTPSHIMDLADKRSKPTASPMKTLTIPDCDSLFSSDGLFSDVGIERQNEGETAWLGKQGKVDIYYNGLAGMDCYVITIPEEALLKVKGYFANAAKGMVKGIPATSITEYVKMAVNYRIMGMKPYGDDLAAKTLDRILSLPIDRVQQFTDTVKSLLEDDQDDDNDIESLALDLASSLDDERGFVLKCTPEDIEVIHNIELVFDKIYGRNVNAFAKRYWNEQANRISTSNENCQALLDKVIGDYDALTSTSGTTVSRTLRIYFVPTLIDIMRMYKAAGQTKIRKQILSQVNAVDEDISLLESFYTVNDSQSLYNEMSSAVHVSKNDPHPGTAFPDHKPRTWKAMNGDPGDILSKFEKKNREGYTEYNIITSKGLYIPYDKPTSPRTYYILTLDQFVDSIDPNKFTITHRSGPYNLSGNEVDLSLLEIFLDNTFKAGAKSGFYPGLDDYNFVFKLNNSKGKTPRRFYS